MVPEEYIGTDPFGNSTKMSKIVVSDNTSYLPLAEVKQTDSYILSMWMCANSSKTVTICHGDKCEPINVLMSWTRFETEFDSTTGNDIGLLLPTGTYYIWHAKLEKGNKPSDWTPAPEDLEKSAKTYTDAQFKILDGKIVSEVERVDGLSERVTKFEQDSDGFTWTIDETAIVASVNEYYKSDSATSLVGGSWSESQPPWEEGKYIWMRTKNTNGKGYSDYTTEVCITGNTGAKGDKGKGVKSSTVTYQEGTSDTTAPTGTWEDSIPSVTKGRYLWTKTVITYTDNSTSTIYSVAYIPTNGIDGDSVTISSTSVTYQTSASNTSAPTGSWSSSVPSTSPDKPYLWTKTVVNYSPSGSTTSYGVSSTMDSIEIGGRNLLSDTTEPTMTKKAGPGNKYLSDSGNADYMSGTFVAVSDLPIPEFTHVYQFTCSTPSDTSTAGRSLCFYSGGTVPMINGQEYTMSMYARKISGNGKIRFMVGYESYPDYNNYIDVTPSWRRYSYTFTYSDSATGGSGGAIACFGANCSVVGVVQTFGWKLEKGNKATDWGLSVADLEYASNEAAKTATNYMKFKNNGLTVGNMTEDTLGKNVLIDADSVDIRNGYDVLASYGEEIALKHDGNDAFTIKKSAFLALAKSENRYFESTSETSTSSGVIGTVSKTLTLGDTYIWHIGKVNRYAIFKIPTSLSSIIGSNTVAINKMLWSSNEPSKITIIGSNGSDITGPCAYCDANGFVDVAINGTLWINNTGDVNGVVDGTPPLGIGKSDGNHLEIDGNEIMAKSDNITPSHLFLNMEGGNVSINNNCNRAISFQDGAIFAKNSNYNDGNWLEIIDGINDYGNTTFGYGGYLNSIGETNIYGNKINLASKDGVKIDDVNGNECLRVYGTDKVHIGKHGYDHNKGITYLSGYEVWIRASNYLNSNRNLRVLWSGAYYMKADQTISLSNNISYQLSGIILAWSAYVDGAACNYDWNYIFVPKEHVSRHSGAGVAMTLITSTGWTRASKCVYISDGTITGNANNDKASTEENGWIVNPSGFVLRYVYGV